MSTIQFLTSASYLLSVIFCSDVSILTVDDTTDWQLILDELTEYRQGWLSSSVTNYVYRSSSYCFCDPCVIAPKYVVIEDSQPTYVEFDTDSLDSYSTCAPIDYIQSPLNSSFHDITRFYDLAIAHANKGLAANCSDPTYNMICGGSLTYAFDPTYFYLTSLSLGYGPYVADAGVSYTITCLTPSADQASSTSYNNTCNKFTEPSEGDACGESGIDCDALKCSCNDCSDGSDESYGCCGCRLVSNTFGELMCSGLISQDLVCADSTVTCGGIAGISCADGLYCVDDTSDDCDPDAGGADCGGLCVAIDDSCADHADCVEMDCLCAECDDDSGNYYGCCGCIWQLSSADGDDMICSSYISQDAVCPATETTEAHCICTQEYDPYCCYGSLYGNECEAACDGFDVDTDAICVEGECGASCGDLAGLLECEDGFYCVDNPYDDCALIALTTDADCLGVCVAAGDSCADCDVTACECYECDDGSGSSYGCCDDCKYVLNDAGDDVICDQYIDREDVCPVEASTTEDSASYCDDAKVAAQASSFDNDDSDVGGFDLCKFCICREKGHPHCAQVAGLWFEEDEDIVSLFSDSCDAEDYEDLQDADGEQCAFVDLRVKPADALEACGCSALYCNGNPSYPDLDFDNNSVSRNQVIVAIGIASMFALFSVNAN